jgi:hypothetical protein
MQNFNCTTYPRTLGAKDSPAGTTLPEVAKFPLRNNAASAVAALNPVLKDTKTKGFSP